MRLSVVLLLAYVVVTILACINTAANYSVTVGVVGFAASALCYWGGSAFMGSLLARREKGYQAFDLVGIGALSLLLIAIGVALMVWSGFQMRFGGLQVGGVEWALLGAFVTVFVVKKEDALRGDFTTETHPLPVGTRVVAVRNVGLVKEGAPGIVTGTHKGRPYRNNMLVYFCTFADNSKIAARPNEIDKYDHGYTLAELEHPNYCEIMHYERAEFQRRRSIQDGSAGQ
jgi:hypothetical protein